MQGSDHTTSPIERETLCVPCSRTGQVLNHGDEGFGDELRRLYITSENDAAEKLVKLKARLRSTTHDFWKVLMEGLLSLTGSQFGFCSKRLVVDDQDPEVPLPRIGEPNSYLMALALYWDDGHGIKDMLRDFKYMSYGAPCGFMCHDKVFLAPKGLSELTRDNPNELPFPCEAYLGIPLFHDGACFAHFGLMWTAEGLENRSLSWGYLEMVMHSLEDIVLHRILEGTSFTRQPRKASDSTTNIVSEAFTGPLSFKPYARSLSHELRTPMQGVVGMLDIMQATVQEATESNPSEGLRDIFQSLKESIEVVQDSSRRAVEATDNVVHAYALNMQIPDTPVDALDEHESKPLRRATTGDAQSEAFLQPQPPLTKSGAHKRRRASSSGWERSGPYKFRAVEQSPSAYLRGRSISPPRTEAIRQAVRESEQVTTPVTPERWRDVRVALGSAPTSGQMDGMRPVSEGEGTPGPTFRYTRIRDLLHYVITESLRVGGRPDSAIAESTLLGELIEVRTKTSAGEPKTTMIECSVDPFVPETILVDERDLSKLVSCVLLNAIKFTDSGKITLNARLSHDHRSILLNVADSGPGIPKEFLPKLFKPFARGDDSLTRQKDGLGLGLLVAKGIARKIRGDLKCVRSEVSGPNHGTEFEIKVPIASSDGGSFPGSPLVRTPTPSGSSPELDVGPAEVDVKTVTRGSSALTETIVLGPAQSDKTASPLDSFAASRRNSQAGRPSPPTKLEFDKNLAQKYPLTFLVAEDNKINRKLLVKMLLKLGYSRNAIYEAYDGAEAVRQMAVDRDVPVDLVLMDLWMPTMDGYEATERILGMEKYAHDNKVTVLAVSADVTEEALTRAAEVGIEGFMTKPYKLTDLERLIAEYSVRKRGDLLVKQNGLFFISS